ncbi:MAG: hypothetical protein U0930_02685 [Pirellulales bacterium]
MSTGTWSSASAADKVSTRQQDSVTPFAILRAIGSLKITVTLFVFAILIVLVGTLAQDDETLVEVKREYFNSWVASVPLDVFVPSTMYPHTRIPGSIPLPGGALIGVLLMINLIAAKVTRFTIFAKGLKLIAGILVSALGGLLVTAVIMTGHAVDGLQGKPPISYDQLWTMVKVGLVVISLATAAYAIVATGPRLFKIPLWAFVVLCGAMSLTLFATEMRLDDPGLRIVWQLAQATVASSVVLAGFLILFGKRGGNMLIHVGIALLMVGQFVFGDRQIEQKVFLHEGGSSNVTHLPRPVRDCLHRHKRCSV